MMIYISDKKAFKKHIASIEEFTLLYNSGFPDINERENIQAIFNRVQGTKTNYDPNTVLILYPLENRITAGLIADWYEESKCIHLTYIIVSPTVRNKGIAREILSSGLPKIIQNIKVKYHININAVFFESNIPARTVKDSFNPRLRLKIFSKLGAKWINIPYTQPALDSEKEKVENLYLLTFPILNQNRNSIEFEVVISFLDNLYKSLSIENPDENEDYLKMVKFLVEQKDKSNKIRLHPVPFD